MTKAQVMELADKIHQLVVDEVPADRFTTFGFREAYVMAGIKLFGCDVFLLMGNQAVES